MKRQPATGIVLFWFRRDLRLTDNMALFHALRSGHPVLLIFIFDRNILDKLTDRADSRVQFIHQEVCRIKKELEEQHDSTLCTFHGKPERVIRELLRKYKILSMYANEDYEPYARERDETIQHVLKTKGVSFHLYKDQVIFAKDEVMKPDRTPYTMFTPYSRQWMARLNESSLRSVDVKKYAVHFYRSAPETILSLDQLGFAADDTMPFPVRTVQRRLIRHYAERRDIPAADATSHLGMHLRFGTISVRRLVRTAEKLSPVFLTELIWREFFMQVLWHFPHVAERCFKSQYDAIPWRNDEKEFIAWCTGITGYPLVDAGMRELNATGFMHNRVRMVVASFLTKHLLIDWRWGEAYFAEKLLDYELASNNGNWQWVAGTGCDAAPYFRIFNPTEQAKKYDPDGAYVRKWIPELGTSGYPPPIVDHREARERALRVYKECLMFNAAT